MEIKVLGSGCAKCRATVETIETVARETGRDIALEKVEDMRRIAGYGVMSTPAVVVDGKVAHKGSVPTREQVRAWLA
ncbi:thioredoxin family protein [Amaricoccus solimangrovi]|uniref:Thioredoxin family protein n=1 Tax=Amaricoccus solimangrovi TaxID=2589815 RepID=A0A501WMX8_9RHOB|nr:thioredoxin family protein [Amaricoccus solimangrovi]TPE49695.1 thioredoxin family protein [Amaricoccus solimangrovi]